MAPLWPFPPMAHVSPMSALQGGTQQLYLRAMDSLEPTPIPGTEEPIEPVLLARRPMGGLFRWRSS